MPKNKDPKTNKKDILKIISVPVVFASLCCLSPVILVAFGLSSVTFAASLSNTLYSEYKWYFRAVGLILLAISIAFYYRKKGVCTLDQAKKRKNEIINTVAIVLVSAVIGYIFFLYFVVDWVGQLLNIWV
jgi:TctA family transporter